MQEPHTKLLNAVPRCVYGTDWRDFIIEHPWYPKRLLVRHFHIRPYDLDNYKRGHPDFVRKYNSPTGNFRKAVTPADLSTALAKAWGFVFEEVLGIDLRSPNAVPTILKISGLNKSPWAFLCDSRTFRQLEGYENWIKEGYTQLAFIVCRVHPGPEWAERIGIKLVMFSQTGRKLNRAELIALLEHIYLRFFVQLPENATTDALTNAKDRFCIRAGENSFLTGPMLARYGFTGHLARGEGIRSIIDGLRDKFTMDLGRANREQINWSPDRARRELPHRSFGSCLYCGRKPVELHHLLSRARYPALIYEDENLVPLCVNIHQAITRNLFSKDSIASLAQAEAHWKTARKGKKLNTFDIVMRELHVEFY